MPATTFPIKAIPLRSGPERALGTCGACGRALRANLALHRGRDAHRDEELNFADRFCSHACYHAYALRLTSPSAAAQWN